MLAKTAIAALSSIGILGIGGILLYKKNLKEITVIEALKRESGTKILDTSTEEKQEWSKIIANNSEASAKLKLKNFINENNPKEENSDGEMTEEKLKKACEKMLSEKATQEKISKSKAYCTVSSG